jgi:hypothetical protein
MKHIFNKSQIILYKAQNFLQYTHILATTITYKDTKKSMEN